MGYNVKSFIAHLNGKSRDHGTGIDMTNIAEQKVI